MKMDIKPNSGRAKVAIVFFYLTVAVSVISILLGVYFDYISSSSESPEIVFGFFSLAIFLQFILAMITAIPFIMWFRRAYYNLHQFRDNLHFSEGWAAGAWFVPFLNLVRPNDIMCELVTETPEFVSNVYKEEGKMDLDGLRKIWWICFILGNISSNFGSRFINEEVFILEDYLIASRIITVSHVLYVVSGIAVISIIKRYNKYEEVIASHTEGDILEQI